MNHWGPRLVKGTLIQVCRSNNPWVCLLVRAYFAAKRHWYQWRYPNLHLAPGVMIRGRLRIRGPVKVTIGSQTRISQCIDIYGRGLITIGRNVSLNGCWLGCQSAITIADDCLISDCYIVDTDYHNLEPRLRHAPPGPKVTSPIVLERNVWVGAHATIMKGVHVGQDSVVGLGCIVRQSVPPGVVVIGNPQEIIRRFMPEELSEPLPEALLAELQPWRHGLDLSPLPGSGESDDRGASADACG